MVARFVKPAHPGGRLMGGHSTSSHGGHGHSRLQMAGHLLRALPEFWTSDLNRAVVEIADLRPGDVALDVGAGLGPAVVEAAEAVRPSGRVIAVEPSRVFRSVLGMRARGRRYGQAIDVRSGTAEHLPLPDDSVHAAWAVNAAHHFDDFGLAAAEFARVLRSGGRLVLVEEQFGADDHPASEFGFPDVGLDAGTIVEALTGVGLVVEASGDRALADRPCTVVVARSGMDEEDGVG